MVEFLEDHAVEVPTNWLNENEKKCYWPSKSKSKKLKLAVLSAAAPTKEFVPLSIRVLHRGKFTLDVKIILMHVRKSLMKNNIYVLGWKHMTEIQNEYAM